MLKTQSPATHAKLTMLKCKTEALAFKLSAGNKERNRCCALNPKWQTKKAQHALPTPAHYRNCRWLKLFSRQYAFWVQPEDCHWIKCCCQMLALLLPEVNWIAVILCTPTIGKYSAWQLFWYYWRTRTTGGIPSMCPAPQFNKGIHRTFK